jgi:hypothetical protein
MANGHFVTCSITYLTFGTRCATSGQATLVDIMKKQSGIAQVTVEGELGVASFLVNYF